MNVVVISSTVFKVHGPQGVLGYGGLEPLAWWCAKGLAALGHKVAIAAPDGSECEGAEVIHIGPERQVSEAQAYKVYKERLRSADVVIDHSWSKFGYKGIMEGWQKAPCLAVTHAPVNTMLQTLPPGVDKPCFVCISQDQANHFEALFGREARTCYNGIDLEFYRPLGIPCSGRFLFLARFSSIKGAALAIEACLEAGVGLDLVGDTSITNEPEYFERCMRLSEQQSKSWNSNKGRQIKVIGGVPRSETVWWYSQARALVHPNKMFREPFGLAPVEALACGCPVGSWDLGAMKETVEHGEVGFRVRSTTELSNLLKEGRFDSLVRPYCREWASQFSIGKMVRRYEELCVEAVEGGW